MVEESLIRALLVCLVGPDSADQGHRNFSSWALSAYPKDPVVDWGHEQSE